MKCEEWTSYFDIHGKPLLEPITSKIKDLDTAHIMNILHSEYLFLTDEYKDAFDKELERRNL